MKVYGEAFGITEQNIEVEKIEYVPAEGLYVPIIQNSINGLENCLNKHNSACRRGQLKTPYIYITDLNQIAMFCLRYKNDEITVIECKLDETERELLLKYTTG